MPMGTSHTATLFELFQVLATATRIDYIITNDIYQNSTEAVEEKISFPCKVEQLHREEKKITDIENCQCRL